MYACSCVCTCMCRPNHDTGAFLIHRGSASQLKPELAVLVSHLAPRDASLEYRIISKSTWLPGSYLGRFWKLALRLGW